MCLFGRKEKKTNYGKIFAVTVAVVAGTCTVAYVVYKLFLKFFSCCECDCDDDLLDECEDCTCEVESADEDEECECCCESEAE